MSKTMRLHTDVFLACAAIVGCLGDALAHQTSSTNEAVCLSNLKQVSTALAMYTQDFDEKLPPMQSLPGTQKLLNPYTRNNQVYACPATTKAYKTNPALSRKIMSVIAEPSKAVTFYDALPHEDTQYSVAYFDGHVKREAKVPSLAVKLVAKKPQPHSKRARSRR